MQIPTNFIFTWQRRPPVDARKGKLNLVSGVNTIFFVFVEAKAAMNNCKANSQLLTEILFILGFVVKSELFVQVNSIN